MNGTAREDLADLLRDLRGGGSFCTRRTAPFDDLTIEVRGVGPLRLPVTAAQAKELRLVARPARYGHGEQTILDRSTSSLTFVAFYTDTRHEVLPVQGHMQLADQPTRDSASFCHPLVRVFGSCDVVEDLSELGSLRLIAALDTQHIGEKSVGPFKCRGALRLSPKRPSSAAAAPFSVHGLTRDPISSAQQRLAGRTATHRRLTGGSRQSAGERGHPG